MKFAPAEMDCVKRILRFEGRVVLLRNVVHALRKVEEAIGRMRRRICMVEVGRCIFKVFTFLN